VARSPDGAGMLNPRIGALVALALGASVLTGCGGHSGGGTVKGDRSGPAASAGPTGGRPPAPRFDPPRRFAEASAVIDGAPLAIADGVGYHYTDDGLAAADLATGQRRWQVTLPGAERLVTGPMAHDDPPVPGIVTDAQGQAFLVAAYFETVTGTGTQQDAQRTTVVAVDLSGRTRWTAALPADLLPRVVGGIRDDRGAAAVLDAGGTAVLDAGSGGVRWTAKDVRPGAVDGTTIVGVRRPGGGYDPWPSVGLRSTDGAALWTGPTLGSFMLDQPPDLMPAGPGRAILAGGDGYDHVTLLIDTATGRQVGSLPGVLHCVYDAKATDICWAPHVVGNDPELVIGVDAGSGQELWSLPDKASGRVAIDVTAAFHGAVYGSARHGSVVLDARTGADLVPDATVAPTQVVPGYGLRADFDGSPKTTVYPATG